MIICQHHLQVSLPPALLAASYCIYHQWCCLLRSSTYSPHTHFTQPSHRNTLEEFYHDPTVETLQR